MRSSRLLRWSLPGLVLLTAGAIDSVDRHARSTTQHPGREQPAAVSGLRVVVDPATGEIVGQPTADQLGRLGTVSLGERRRAEDLEVFDLPNGAQGVVLDGWADHALRIERGADGAWRWVCSRGDSHGGDR